MVKFLNSQRFVACGSFYTIK